MLVAFLIFIFTNTDKIAEGYTEKTNPDVIRPSEYTFVFSAASSINGTAIRTLISVTLVVSSVWTSNYDNTTITI